MSEIPKSVICVRSAEFRGFIRSESVWNAFGIRLPEFGREAVEASSPILHALVNDRFSHCAQIENIVGKVKENLGVPDYCAGCCVEVHTWRDLALDTKLVDLVLEVSGERTKKAAVTKALQEFVARPRQKRLRELRGKLEWDHSFDYKGLSLFVDTSVWSVALRCDAPSEAAEARELMRVLKAGETVVTTGSSCKNCLDAERDARRKTVQYFVPLVPIWKKLAE